MLLPTSCLPRLTGAARGNPALFEALAREALLPMLYVSHAVDEVARLADEIVGAWRRARGGARLRVRASHRCRPHRGFPAARRGIRGGSIRRTGQADAARLRRRRLGGEEDRPPLASKLRVRLRAEDHRVRAGEPRAISANNILAAVAAIHREAEEADVQLLWARRASSRASPASRARVAWSRASQPSPSSRA